jgi:hypothetical protein
MTIGPKSIQQPVVESPWKCRRLNTTRMLALASNGEASLSCFDG